ncbi:hypothetical protein [Achromobacter aloeverae]|nr:hypothetical protein [Achromobacter aloeverae]
MNKRRNTQTSTDDRADPPRETGLNARIFPPTSPVEVPRLPPRKTPAAGTSSTDAATAHAPVELDEDHNWADNTRPAPYKKKVRTSIF